MRPVSRKTEVELPNEETLENAVLYQKVHCCGLAEVLIPLPESTQSPEHVGTLATVGACGGGIAVKYKFFVLFRSESETYTFPPAPQFRESGFETCFTMYKKKRVQEQNLKRFPETSKKNT